MTFFPCSQRIDLAKACFDARFIYIYIYIKKAIDYIYIYIYINFNNFMTI